MNTLIVYSSKYGATKEIAERIKAGLKGEVVLLNAKEDRAVELEKYDTILLGASVYAGNVGKEMKAFCEKHKEALMRKRVGLFFGCLMKGQVENYSKNNFGEELVKHFYIAEECGGAFYVAKMNFVERMMTKLVVKSLKDAAGNPVLYSKQMVYQDFNTAAIQKIIDRVNVG